MKAFIRVIQHHFAMCAWRRSCAAKDAAFDAAFDVWQKEKDRRLCEWAHR
jgi:hypothetical protein